MITTVFPLKINKYQPRAYCRNSMVEKRFREKGIAPHPQLDFQEVLEHEPFPVETVNS